MQHWSIVKHVLCYIKGTFTHGILIQTFPSLNLHVFVNADWVEDVNDQSSTSTYLVCLGATPISWSFKKQNTITHSSIEVEYYSLASTMTELNWIQNLSTKLHINLFTTPTI